jgi:formate-dependent phosphoribosylglycinamide formyltransferase (GAR transformylase)
MIKQVIPDLSPLRRFDVRHSGTELFAKNLGHAHKTTEYMAAWRPSPPQPARLTRSTPGLFCMIKQVIPDFSTVTLFHVRQLGTKIFPKNLGHAHKVNEYMAAMAAISSKFPNGTLLQW